MNFLREARETVAKYGGAIRRESNPLAFEETYISLISGDIFPPLFESNSLSIDTYYFRFEEINLFRVHFEATQEFPDSGMCFFSIFIPKIKIQVWPK